MVKLVFQRALVYRTMFGKVKSINQVNLVVVPHPLRGNTHILTVVDHLTKLIHLIPYNMRRTNSQQHKSQYYYLRTLLEFSEC